MPCPFVIFHAHTHTMRRLAKAPLQCMLRLGRNCTRAYAHAIHVQEICIRRTTKGMRMIGTHCGFMSGAFFIFIPWLRSKALHEELYASVLITFWYFIAFWNFVENFNFFLKINSSESSFHFIIYHTFLYSLLSFSCQYLNFFGNPHSLLFIKLFSLFLHYF